MPRTRITWIDTAKGIAFIFIVAGHLGILFPSTVIAGGMPPIIKTFSFTFHLPTFFIVSGYFFHKDARVTAAFLKKNFKHLVLPYIVTCLFIILGCTIAGQLRSGTGASEFVRWTQASLWGAGDRSGVALWNVERIGGIWFLLALFWGQLLLALTNRFDRVSRFIILFAFMALGVYTSRFVWLPFSIQSGFGCAIYLYIGMLARDYRWLEKDGLKKWIWPILIALWAVVIRYGGNASIAMCGYPLGILDIISGIAGCICICAISRFIDDFIPPLGKVLQLMGRNTLPLFSFHIFEDNVLIWGQIGSLFSSALGGFGATWILVLAIRIGVDAALSACVYVLPFTRAVYFANAKSIRQKSLPDQSAE